MIELEKVYAPILIPTLYRYEHLKNCLESLVKNTLADQTDVYIALDYPVKESHWEGYNKICDYLNTFKGFGKLTIIKRDENYGAYNNLRDAKEVVFKKYDRIIISEDDNVFSPNFLEYINAGFEKYGKDSNAIAICGYAYPVKLDYQDNNALCIQTNFSAWGFGMWRNLNLDLERIRNQQFFINILLSPRLLFKVFKSGIRNVNYLIDLAKNKTTYWPGDIVYSIYMVVNNKYTINPVVSKVRNMGWDGSGENSGLSEIYAKQEIDNQCTFVFNGNDDYALISNQKKLIKYYRFSMYLHIRTILKLVKWYVLYMFHLKRSFSK